MSTGNKRRAIQVPTKGGTIYIYLDGKLPQMGTSPGFHECWYRLDEAVAIAKKNSAPLVIISPNNVNGVVVAQHHGIPATCMCVPIEPLDD